MKIAVPVILSLVMLFTGCLGMGHDMSAMGGTLNTGEIAAGDSKTLTIATKGSFSIHCHQHPFMKQTVEVTDSPAESVHVHISDGPSTGDYRFDAQNLTIGKGSTVTYHNHGAQVHSATNAMDGM